MKTLSTHTSPSLSQVAKDDSPCTVRVRSERPLSKPDGAVTHSPTVGVIRQRGPTCSIAALCAAHGLSQEQYELILSEVERQGYHFVSLQCEALARAVAFGKYLIAKRGYYVPDSYAMGYLSAPMSGEPDLSGKGIVWVVTENGAVTHVVPYEDSQLFDTNRTAAQIARRKSETWKQLCRRYRQYGKLYVHKQYRF